MRVLFLAASCVVVAVWAASTGQATAAIYNDTTSEVFDPSFTHMDINSVEVTNDAAWLYVKVNTEGDLDAVNWGKYAIGIDNGSGGGDNSNGWGRNIDWGRSITHWTATWADDGGTGVGGQNWEYDSGSWGLISNPVGDDSGHAGGMQKFAIALSDLGVGPGDTIEFDVVSTGGSGSDPGVDHLSRSDMSTTGWGEQSQAGSFLTYTLVPEPSALACFALLGLGVVGRRRG